MLARLSWHATITGHYNVLLLAASSQACITFWSSLINLFSSFQCGDIRRILCNQDDDGCTPFHYACQEGNLTSLITLVGLGVSAQKRSCKQQSPMHFASKHGRVEACKILLESDQVEVVPFLCITLWKFLIDCQRKPAVLRLQVIYFSMKTQRCPHE